MQGLLQGFSLNTLNNLGLQVAGFGCPGLWKSLWKQKPGSELLSVKVVGTSWRGLVQGVQTTE